MLKLNKNIVPAGIIDGANKVFTLPSYIGYVTNIVVDGNIVVDFTFEHDKVTLTSAPNTTITVSFFSREERDIMGNGEVTMGDLIDEVYDEIGRKQYSKVYPKEKIRRDLNKTIGVYLDELPERSQIQHYSFKGKNGLNVTTEGHTVDLPKDETYDLDIEGTFLVGRGLYYEYFDYDGETFTVSGADLIDAGDRILVGHRIPYGVERVSEIYINGIKLEYIDSRDFYMDTADHFTITKDYQGNEYLFLPFSSKLYSCVVKYVPDYAVTNTDEDILNIPYKYTRVFVYDVVYRLLASREDDRWQIYEKLRTEEKQVFKGFKAKATRKTKSKIGFADTFGERDTRRFMDFLPDDVYDPYLN